MKCVAIIHLRERAEFRNGNNAWIYGASGLVSGEAAGVAMDSNASILVCERDERVITGIRIV